MTKEEYQRIMEDVQNDGIRSRRRRRNPVNFFDYEFTGQKSSTFGRMWAYGIWSAPPATMDEPIVLSCTEYVIR